jgi:anaerobic magnesium-protoporphyrin IX monomethyl ester cyclase
MEGGSMAVMNLIDRDEMLGKRTWKKKRVALVACPWLFYNHVEFRSQQLGLGFIGAYAEQYGHEIVAFIDPMIKGGDRIEIPIDTRLLRTKRFGHPDSWIVEQIPSDTDVVAINAPFTDSRIVLYPLVRAIKAKYPSMLVVVGGVLATTLPEQILRECPADIVVKGEGEIAFARILNDYALSSIPGLVFRKPDGSFFHHPVRSEQLKSVDSIPPPGYGFRPMEEYVVWSPRGDRADRTLSLISSRGCPFTCEFCSIPEKGQRWRPFTPERVLDEIKHAIEAWGVNHIEFEDDNFTLQEPRALQVLNFLADLRKRGYRFSCSFPNGIMIDKMTPSLAQLLVEAGSDIIYLPVESGDTRVLMAMDKPMAEHHLEKTLQVAKWCLDVGLTVSTFFITAYPGGRLNSRFKRNSALLEEHKHYIHEHPDHPGDLFMFGEDEQSFDNTIEYCKKLRALGVPGITPLIATPYPGTELYEVCELFDWLPFPDAPDVLTTVSYAAVDPGRVLIDTPFCSRNEAYRRWKHMMDMFPTYHNVRKQETSDHLLTGAELNARLAG